MVVTVDVVTITCFIVLSGVTIRLPGLTRTSGSVIKSNLKNFDLHLQSAFLDFWT